MRETQEEFGLTIDASGIVWKQKCQGGAEPTKHFYFLVAHISQAEVSAIRFGDEGQYWRMMEIEAFLSHPQAVPQFQQRLAHFLSGQGEDGVQVGRFMASNASIVKSTASPVSQS